MNKKIRLLAALMFMLSFFVPSASAVLAAPVDTFTASVTRSCTDNSVEVFFDPTGVTGIEWLLTNESDSSSMQGVANPTVGRFLIDTDGHNFDRVVLTPNFGYGVEAMFTAYMGECGTFDLELVGPPPAPVDIDGDGVFDDVDQCNDTPVGTDVDANGCAIVIPDVWQIDTVVLACTSEGVNVTFTVSGDVPDDGGIVDIQVRLESGGTPVESAFGDVIQGNSGPYDVDFESDSFASGSFQAWVFRVGTNDPVKSNVVNCGEEPVMEVTPADPTVTQAVRSESGETTPPSVTPAITEGIVYTITGNVVPGSTVTVTATPKEDYVLGSATGWTMNEDGTATFTIKLDAVDDTSDLVDQIVQILIRILTEILEGSKT